MDRRVFVLSNQHVWKLSDVRRLLCGSCSVYISSLSAHLAVPMGSAILIGSAIGWSDLALFCNFRKATHFCWSGIFLGGQFQKIGKFSCVPSSHAGQSFHFQKIAGTLNKNFCITNLPNTHTSYIKEQSQRRKFEIKSCLIFF